MALQKNAFEQAIENYLNEYAKNDATFAKKYANPKKSISECCKYIYSEINRERSRGETCVVMEDQVVYGMAVHYYDEDDIKVGEAPANVVVEQSATPPAKEKKQSKPRKPRAKKEAAPAPIVEAEIDINLPDELIIPIF